MALRLLNWGIPEDSQFLGRETIYDSVQPASLLFSSRGRQNVVADSRGGRLTSDGGLLLRREVDRRPDPILP